MSFPFPYHALHSRCAVTLLRSRHAQTPLVCISATIAARAYFTTTRAAHLKDNGLAASADGDAVPAAETTKDASDPPLLSSDTSAPVSSTVDGVVHAAADIGKTNGRAVTAMPATDLKYYINREGLSVRRERPLRIGLNWTDTELTLLRKFHDEKAPLPKIMAAFPDRTEDSLRTRMRFFGKRPRTWDFEERKLLLQKRAEGYTYDEIRSRWFPNRTTLALQGAFTSDAAKTHEAKTLTPETAARLAQLVRDDKTPYEIRQVLPDVPSLSWNIQKLRMSLRDDTSSSESARQSFKYSDDEWQHILELHALGNSNSQIAAAVNRSPLGIARVLRGNNVIANKPKSRSSGSWTKLECAVLEPYIHRRVINYAEIEKLLDNRTANAISSKIAKLRKEHNVVLGLERTKWSEAELALLENEIETYRPYKDAHIIRTIAEKIGREPRAVYIKFWALRKRHKESKS